MNKVGGFLLGVGAVASAFAMSVAGGISEARASEASMAAMSDAEKLERLDIMLLVTSLRCRMGEDDYQADYTRFQTRHRQELNRANRAMHAVLMKRLGNAGAERELDRLNVKMANDYGNGHPTLGCHELKIVTQSLADAAGAADLIAAAAQLLDTPPQPSAPAQMVTVAPMASPPAQLVYELAPAAGPSADASAPPTQLVYNLVPAAPAADQPVAPAAPVQVVNNATPAPSQP
jgi:hypothetical protein